MGPMPARLQSMIRSAPRGGGEGAHLAGAINSPVAIGVGGRAGGPGDGVGLQRHAHLHARAMHPASIDPESHSLQAVSENVDGRDLNLL